MIEYLIEFITNHMYNFIAFLMILFAEVMLLLTNYTARSKYSDYFREMNSVWKFFDDRGWTSISLVIHFAIVSNLSLTLFLSDSTGILWCVLGILWSNWMVDRMTLEWRGKCILMGCPDLVYRKKCTACKKVDKYTISGTLTLKISEKKDEFFYKVKAKIMETIKR